MIKLNLSGKCIVEMISQVQNWVDAKVSYFRNEKTFTFHPRYGLGIIRSKSFANEGFSVINLDFKVSDNMILHFDFSKFNDLFFVFIDLGSVTIYVKDASAKSISSGQICMVSSRNLKNLRIDSDQHIRMYVIQVYSDIPEACTQNGLIGLNRSLFKLLDSVIIQSDIFFLDKVCGAVHRNFKDLFSCKSATTAQFFYHKSSVYIILLRVLSEMHENLIDLILPKTLRIKDVEYVREVLLTIPIWLSKPNPIVRILERSNTYTSKFREGFKLISGMTLVAYIKLNRLDMARELIEHSELEKDEILKKIGAKNEAYFDRIFKAKYGMKLDDYFIKHRSYA